jgi:hypothetical protein
VRSSGLFLVLCYMFSSAHSAALFDAESASEALAMGAVDFRHVDEMRNMCSRLMPERKTLINAYTLIWLDRNKAENWAIQSFTKVASDWWKTARDRTTDVGLTAFRVLPKDRQVAHCESFYGRIQTGELDIAQKTPKVSRFLAQYLENNPLSPIDIERLNFVGGCTKAAYNRARVEGGDFDLDKANPLCQCIWQTTEQNTTAAERALVNEAARRGEPANKLPHVQRIAPMLQKCFTSS